MNNRLAALDGLRGVAALAVVFTHVAVLSPALWPAWTTGQADGTLAGLLMWSPLHIVWAGSEAVWIFFMLSGFVLSRRYLTGDRLRLRFYYPSRLVRLYLPMAGSVVLAILLALLPHEPVIGGFGFLAHAPAPIDVAGLSRTSLLVFGVTSDLNGAWWSLQWEVIFSLLLPVVVAVALALQSHAVAVGVLCLAVSAFAPTLGTAFGLGATAIGAVGFLPMFGIGVALAARESALRRPRRSLNGWSGYGALLACVVAVTIDYPLHWFFSIVPSGPHPMLFDGLTRAIKLAGCAGLLVLALGCAPFITFLLLRPVRWLGTRSYSLFLVHYPVIVGMAYAFRLAGMPWWFVVLAPAVSLLVAAGFHRFVEAPSIRLSRTVGRPVQQVE